MSRRVMRDSIASSSRGVMPSAAASLLRIGLAAAALEPLPLAAQPIEAALLGARGAEAHHRPAATDVLLDVRADPPHGVGREAHAARRDRSDRPPPADRGCPPGSDREGARRRCGTRTRSSRRSAGCPVTRRSAASWSRKRRQRSASSSLLVRRQQAYIDRCGSGTRSAALAGPPRDVHAVHHRCEWCSAHAASLRALTGQLDHSGCARVYSRVSLAQSSPDAQNVRIQAGYADRRPLASSWHTPCLDCAAEGARWRTKILIVDDDERLAAGARAAA